MLSVVSVELFVLHRVVHPQAATHRLARRDELAVRHQGGGRCGPWGALTRGPCCCRGVHASAVRVPVHVSLLPVRLAVTMGVLLLLLRRRRLVMLLRLLRRGGVLVSLLRWIQGRLQALGMLLVVSCEGRRLLRMAMLQLLLRLTVLQQLLLPPARLVIAACPSVEVDVPVIVASNPRILQR